MQSGAPEEGLRIHKHRKPQFTSDQSSEQVGIRRVREGWTRVMYSLASQTKLECHLRIYEKICVRRTFYVVAKMLTVLPEHALVLFGNKYHFSSDL